MSGALHKTVSSQTQWRVAVPMALIVTLLVVAGCLCVGAVTDIELLVWLLRLGMIAIGVGLVAFVTLTTRGSSSAKSGDDGESVSRRMQNLEAMLAGRTRMLKKAYLDMHSLDRVKDAFLSNLSHEMRTPLTSIMAAEEILSSYADEAPETRHEFLNIIRQESARLLELIGKLLDLVKLEAKALHLHYERVDICQLAEETVGSTLSQRPHLAAAVKIARPSQAVECECDRERIARVLHSMLENAVRYSPENGMVLVTIGLVGEQVSVTVKDDGDRSDERFSDMFEGETPDRRSTASSPFLGHPIAARLASMHGGSLTPARSPAGGTVVTLLLPTRQVEVRAESNVEREAELVADGA